MGKKKTPAPKTPKAAKKAKPASQLRTWKNRIVGHGELDPQEIIAHDKNWRTHPPRQRQALLAVMRKIGWVHTVIINKVTGKMIDGHLRIEEALKARESTVPVTYVQLSKEEEEEILLTLDPIAAMAEENAETLQELTALVKDRLAEVEEETEEALAGAAKLIDDLSTTAMAAGGGNPNYHSAFDDMATEEDDADGMGNGDSNLIDNTEVQRQVDNAMPRCPFCDQILRNEAARKRIDNLANQVEEE